MQALLSTGCMSVARRTTLNLTGLLTLSRKLLAKQIVDAESRDSLDSLTEVAFHWRRELLPHGCPCALVVACTWRHAAYAHSLENGLTQDAFLTTFHNMGKQERILAEALQTCPWEEARQWPVEQAMHMYQTIMGLLNMRVKEVVEWAEGWGKEDITDEQHSAALADASAVFGSLGLEWWPSRGTLIALLRHGKRSGLLSNGRVGLSQNQNLLGVSYFEFSV